MRLFCLALTLLAGACGPHIGPQSAEPARAPIPPLSETSLRVESPVCAPSPAAPPMPAGPLFVSYVHPEGAWVALCQSPEPEGELLLRFGHHGEAPAGASPRVVYADGSTLDVQHFVAVGPRGRWLLVHQAQALVLIDTSTSERTTLRASHERDDPSVYAVAMEHPPASFDREARRLVYLRWGQDPRDTVAVVRELATGIEHVARAPANHRMLGARIDRDGGWLWVWSMPTGITPRAFRRLGGGRRQCAGPHRPDGVDGGLPARGSGLVERRAIALTGGTEGVRPPWIPEAILGLGGSMLTREADGSLALSNAAGERTTIVDAACDALGLHAGAGRASFAVLCRSSSEVRIFEGSAPRPSTTYNFDEPLRLEDGREWRHARWVSAGGRLFDLQGRTQATVPSGSTVLAEHAGRVLYQTDGCEIGIATGEHRTALRPPSAGACTWALSQAGAYVLLGDGAVIDLLSERWGALSGRAWAVHESGTALVTSEQHPLFWERVHFLERPCPCARDATP